MKKPLLDGTALSDQRFPVDPWSLIEAEYSDADLGHTETLFGLGNGYLGMRANPEEGRDAHTHGTYVNGFHETWDIQHAENAFGFARTGQTIVNVPDAKLVKLYIDDEPLLVANADLDSYRRTIDFRSGVLTRELLWRTPGGRLVRVRSQRMISFVERHLGLITFEVEILDGGGAPITISSQLLNRQDGKDEYHVPDAALGEGRDPRQARKFSDRVLEPMTQRETSDGCEIVLGYRCVNSKMTLAAGIRHRMETDCEVEAVNEVDQHQAKRVYSIQAEPGKPIRLTKLVSYHSSTGVPAEELSDRCHRTLTRGLASGVDSLLAEQREWLDSFWDRADIQIDGDERTQQAVRWNLFQLAQASARTNEQGIAAKGVSAGGYDGHYFWDSEVYVVPFLAYTDPEAARKMLRFRWKMLPAARARAEEMSEKGALYPWRTINGEEASAYYAAGTAQYHINAAVAFALHRYVQATDDTEFLASEGAEILVETARMWADLGFFSTNGKRTFHIHRVTGPDEYTTVVNDNTYTNVMARFNLRFAAETVRRLIDTDPPAFEALVRATGLDESEVVRWEDAADSMFVLFDAEQGINPQDAAFLDLEPWDWEGTPPEKYPLLLHFHPLVIYRHQVLKQADVVLATFLRREDFSAKTRRANFEFYDPITTGDSSLSACVQALTAADVGFDDLALEHFNRALFLDLADAHGNTADGIHIASTGGVWACVVYGFAGMTHQGDALHFAPRMPKAWRRVSFCLQRRDTKLRVDMDPDGLEVTVVEGPEFTVGDDRGEVLLQPGATHRIDRTD